MAEVKTEPQNGDAVEVTENEAKIMKQLEYYFSDINLGKDKFMQQEMMKNNGWIPLSVLLTFNRLKALTENEKEIVTALRKSQNSLILISENERQIKRDTENHPLPEMTDDYKKALNARTIHMKGFPLNAQYDDIRGFCAQYGDVESLEIRRTKEKTFKGCIFAVYKTEAEAEKALKGEEKYNDVELLKETKNRYFERKSEFYSIREKNRRKMKKEAKQKVENDAMEVEMKASYVAKAILKLTNVPNNITYQKIKDVLNAYGDTVFVDIEKDSCEAFARFSKENGAEEVLKKIQEKGDGDQLKIDENVVEVKVLEGDDEKNFWQRISKIRSERKNFKNDKSNFKKKGKKNNRLKYHKNRGQKRSADDKEGAPAKQVKVEGGGDK